MMGQMFLTFQPDKKGIVLILLIMLAMVLHARYVSLLWLQILSLLLPAAGLASDAYLDGPFEPVGLIG